MNNMINNIETLTTIINRLIWSPIMLCTIVGTGVYFSFSTGFIQIFKLKAIIKETIFKSLKTKPIKLAKAGITPFQALSTALAGTIGTGNIAGVATAIAIAGPGSIFWMWVSALFGMMTKYAEILLAVKYRIKNPKGEWTGGPMVYIEKGLNAKWLSVIYACLGILASFGVGNITQANSISAAINDAFGIPPVITGIILSLVIGFTIVGGIKKIASVSEKLVPFMSIFYISAAMIVILFNLKRIPDALSLIFNSAFNKTAPIGGFIGVTVSEAIQKGVARGIFTNEAGLGSASIAHAAANTDHPARQGMWGIFEVFFDTIVMCSITALAILVTDKWTDGITGSSLTIAAFDTVLRGAGKYIIAISLTLFAFTSILAWSFYGKKCMEYISSEKYTGVYYICFLIALVLGAVMEINLVWELSDALNGRIIIPNIIGLIGLRMTVVGTTYDGLRKIKL